MSDESDGRTDEEALDLFDGYLGDTLDAEGMRRLESLLRDDAEARASFVRYCRMHTDLHVLARARRAGDRVIGILERARGPGGRTLRLVRTFAGAAAVAACILLAVAGTWYLSRKLAGDLPAAWLVNAQNCRWKEPAGLGDLGPGRTIELSSGLAELRFGGGATVLLQGPARLSILSRDGARLHQGRLAARVPEEARGFQVVLDDGRIVDLGTEFGLDVGDDGAASVRVFSGRVQAYAAEGPAVDLAAPEWARISGGAVAVKSGMAADGPGAFVRAIEPPPSIVPRTLFLDFHRAVESSVVDVQGSGIGLTHRLPGTGAALPLRDENLRLDTTAGLLEITTTKSDINTQYHLDEGEYLGVRLADLGFTGDEDFEITMIVPNIPALQTVGQFGLYAGARSDRVIRGGLISREEPERYGQFLVNNDGGRDSDLNVVGLLSSGDTLRMTLARVDNRYALTVENRTTGGASTLTIRHPDFLDREKDLYVGMFAANTGSDVRKTLGIQEIYVTVRTVSD